MPTTAVTKYSIALSRRRTTMSRLSWSTRNSGNMSSTCLSMARISRRASGNMDAGHMVALKELQPSDSAMEASARYLWSTSPRRTAAEERPGSKLRARRRRTYPRARTRVPWVAMSSSLLKAKGRALGPVVSLLASSAMDLLAVLIVNDAALASHLYSISRRAKKGGTCKTSPGRRSTTMAESSGPANFAATVPFSSWLARRQGWCQGKRWSWRACTGARSTKRRQPYTCANISCLVWI
mmetsp:Transcript_520/g.1615  ORF Transcript_520/g.1615 Transcript_520/m.1615 type:complete len:239 (-) Transcript_520:35-751(-)